MRSKKKLFQSFEWKLFLVVFSLLFSTIILLNTSQQSSPQVRADGKGYFLYLPSLVIHHDIAMKWTTGEQRAEKKATDQEWYGLHEVRDGKYLDKYPIGLAIIWLPFFLLAHIATLLLHGPANGFSALYQASVSFAGALAGALATLMIYKLVRRHFAQKTSYLTAIALVFGTNLMSYATYDSSFTHVYSLCLTTSILYVLRYFYRTFSYKWAILLGLLFGLNIIVRPTNIIFGIIIVLWGLTNKKDALARLAVLKKEYKKLAVLAGMTALAVLPQIIYWKYITGKFFVFSYQDESFNFLKPQLFNILFSTDRGVFFWAPILLLALFGVFKLHKNLKEWRLAFYVFLPVWLWVVSSWHSWQFGQSFGHRAFIDIFPILALCGAGLISSIRSIRIKKATAIFAAIVIFMNLFQTYQYWIVALPSAATTWNIYFHMWGHEIKALFEHGFNTGYFSLIAFISAVFIPFTMNVLNGKYEASPQLAAKPTSRRAKSQQLI